MLIFYIFFIKTNFLGFLYDVRLNLLSLVHQSFRNISVYVDASTACNDLTFLLGETASGTTLATRSWNIRVTQYECNSGLLAPPGCTQYFYGSDTGSVQSYNFAGDYHLANQRQNICIRRESSQCRICYSTSTWTDFQISGGGE